MSTTLEGRLVVAISSRSLFDFEEENRIFEAHDDRAYMQLQLQRLDQPAPPGVAFSLVNKLLAFNVAGGDPFGPSGLAPAGERTPPGSLHAAPRRAIGSLCRDSKAASRRRCSSSVTSARSRRARVSSFGPPVVLTAPLR